MAKPRLLFYLKPEGVEVYSDQTDGPARLDFPEEIVNHQEVFDGEKYSQLLEGFLSQMGISQLEAVILISQPLIFSKEFPYDQSTTAADPNKPLLDYNALNTKIQNFISVAPFDVNQISKLELKGESSSWVLITNKALYQPIVDLVSKMGGKVLSVVPVTVFSDLAQKANLERSDVGLVFGERKTLQSNNFLLSQNIIALVAGKPADTLVDSIEGEEEEEAGGKKSKILLILGALFILAGLLVLAMMLGLIKNPWEKPQAVEVGITPAVEATPSANVAVVVATASAAESTPPAALQDLKKEQMKINITNGSGVSGQGSKVKSILTSLGYKDITIGQTSLSGSTDTQVTYAPKLSTAGRDELIQNLSQTFLTVKTTEATGAAKFDIEIITGVYK